MPCARQAVRPGLPEQVRTSIFPSSCRTRFGALTNARQPQKVPEGHLGIFRLNNWLRWPP